MYRHTYTKYKDINFIIINHLLYIHTIYTIHTSIVYTKYNIYIYIYIHRQINIEHTIHQG